MLPSTVHEDLLHQAIECFWEAFPVFWHAIRAHLREQAVDNYGVTVEQFHILRHIYRGLNSVSDLAVAKGISRPAASKTVDTLVQRGLVSRRQKEADHRFVELELTERGRALLDNLYEETRTWMAGRLAKLQEPELIEIIGAMEALKKTALP